MTQAQVGSIHIEYETFGGAGSPALLLIAGLGDQLVYWPEAFCQRLADRGLFVIRFDNRDIGRSSTVEQEYTLDDMAGDAVGLLDALGVERAHVAGMSQGGMIAQRLALKHPDRLLTATLMSTIGDFSLVDPPPEIVTAMTTMAEPGREGYVDWMLNLMRVGGSPGLEEHAREYAGTQWDRGFEPMGIMRQMMAGPATGDWSGELGSITTPTLVIHGENDRLFTPACGRALADAIPGAELVIVPGRAHDLPWGVEDEVADAIGDFIAKRSA